MKTRLPEEGSAGVPLLSFPGGNLFLVAFSEKQKGLSPVRHPLPFIIEKISMGSLEYFGPKEKAS